MAEPRPALSADALAAITAAAGLSLGTDELDALAGPTATLYAAADSLDALDLADVEPAAVYRLPEE